MLDNQGYTRTRPKTWAPTRTQHMTRACTHTHTNMQYLLLFHRNNDSRMRLIVTLHVHCVSCFTLMTILGPTTEFIVFT